MNKLETKAFIIPIKESIMNKLFKVLNHKGNIRKKSLEQYSFFHCLLLKSSSSFLAEPFVCFCLLLKYLFTTVPGGKFFTTVLMTN